MKSAALDSDGLIKLAKSGLLGRVCEHVSCTISEQVWKESVVEGKERLYEDAFTIEALVKSDAIKKRTISIKTEEPLLGEGELSIWEIWKEGKIDFIVSDDRKFLEYLEERNAPFITPPELIVALTKSKKLGSKEAAEGLEKIKDAISKEAYDAANEKLR